MARPRQALEPSPVLLQEAQNCAGSTPYATAVEPVHLVLHAVHVVAAFLTHAMTRTLPLTVQVNVAEEAAEIMMACCLCG